VRDRGKCQQKVWETTKTTRVNKGRPREDMNGNPKEQKTPSRNDPGKNRGPNLTPQLFPEGKLKTVLNIRGKRGKPVEKCTRSGVSVLEDEGTRMASAAAT